MPPHRHPVPDPPGAEGTLPESCATVETWPLPPAPSPWRDESNLVTHARRELRIIGEDPDTISGLCKVVRAFADMGHSGSSAHFASLYLDKLLRYQPLSELTDDPAEWIDRHAEGMTTTPFWQSERNPEAMSTDGGKTYYLVSELQAAGEMATTPIHRSKPTDRAEPAEDGADHA